ncbi:MAG: hypothetical protein WC208_14365 [Gallionella sp.]|jgi:hypothetical protein
MTSKEEASNTFNALLNGVTTVAGGATSTKEVVDPNARNYKLIAGVVVVLAVLVGGGVWWWMKKKKGGVAVAGGGAGAGTKSFTLTPSVKGGAVAGGAVKPMSGGKS